MKRFLVAIPQAEGSGVELYPMTVWLRQHPEHVPNGLDATFSTSHKLRDGLKRRGWVVQDRESEVRLIRPSDIHQQQAITEVLGSGTPAEDEEDVAQEQSFGLEHQLRDFLAQNLPAVPINGTRLQLYVDSAGRDGVEYPTAVGPIDILAIDGQGRFVVFELKRARTADRAVGQLTRSMGWVKHTIGRDHAVQGVIVAKSIDERLRHAASVIPRVMLLEYTGDFRLRRADELSAGGASG